MFAVTSVAVCKDKAGAGRPGRFYQSDNNMQRTKASGGGGGSIGCTPPEKFLQPYKSVMIMVTGRQGICCLMVCHSNFPMKQGTYHFVCNRLRLAYVNYLTIVSALNNCLCS